MDRRTMLAGLGTTVVAAAIPGRQPVAGGAPDTLDYLDAQLRAHWRADRALGPHAVLDGATAQARTVMGAVDVTTGLVHRRAVELATAFAGFLAWLHQDAGQLGACARWLDATLELAHRSGDAQLVAYALTCKAMVRVDAGDAVAALDLTGAVLVSADQLHPKATAMALQQEALAHALAGDRAAVDRSLDAVGVVLEDMVPERHPWGGDRLQRTPAEVVAVQRATCYGRLGLGDEAALAWDGVWRQARAHERRDVGVYFARHATALVDAGAPAEATHRAAMAVDNLRQTGSARLGAELAQLRDKAVPWALTPAGRDLYDVLATAP